jgi:hypothetical protein
MMVTPVIWFVVAMSAVVVGHSDNQGRFQAVCVGAGNGFVAGEFCFRGLPGTKQSGEAHHVPVTNGPFWPRRAVGNVI